ncbi:MAG: sialidase family protein [Planctomycetota bacterium]|nr:sialidase family protein [Planctomycetota bacterium]
MPERFNGPAEYGLRLDTLTTGFDGKTCWVQCRAGTIPTGVPGASPHGPSVVLTMQKLLLKSSDVFYALHEMRTDDLGATWSGPTKHETLGRRQEANGVEAVICDATPKWHAATGKLLTTGHVARYVGEHLAPDPRPRETAYSVYEPASRTWQPWRTLAMPDEPRFFSAGAGSAQRVDLPDGTVLLPIYYMSPEEGGPGAGHRYKAAVARCKFDGETLSFVELGQELVCPVPRGFAEPSLARWGGRFFMTLRNDVRGYVTRGTDGLHFEEPRPWTFDDGTELGNYNTQQHWVTHSDGLYLVYTRRGLDNDHVFRHRAPLVMARVDPDRLCVIRATERVLIPQRGARLGNFAVTRVSPWETWVTVSEWMQTNGPNPFDYTIPQKYGSDNAVYAARILWARRNEAAEG